MKKYLPTLKSIVLLSLFLFNQSYLLANYNENKILENKMQFSVITIDELKNRIENNQIKLNIDGTIAEDLFLEGYVISSDETGNFYKTLSIQNNYVNATSGIQLELEMVNLYNYYPIGSKINISLKNLKVGIDKGVYKIGFNDPQYFIGRIPSNEVNNYLSRVDNEIYAIEPREYNSISEALKEQNINTLIKINNIQFKNPEIDKTYAIAYTNVSRELIDRSFSVLDLRNSGYATWYDEILPVKSGSIILILSRYNHNYQAYIRDVTDVNFTEERFDVNSNTTNNEEGQELLFKGSDFNNWNEFLSSINSFGLIGNGSTYAKKGVGLGRDNSDALLLDGVPTGNDYVFTVVKNKEKPKNSTKITFYIKGVSSKSLSINLYKNNGQYVSYNLKEVVDKPITIKAEETNSYVGNIDTKGEWVLVTLDISTIDIQDIDFVNLLSLKVGREGNYNLIIDNFKIGDKNLSINENNKSKILLVKNANSTMLISDEEMSELEIFSISGQKMQNYSLNTKKYSFPNLRQKGVYVLKIKLKSGKISTQKIIF